VIARARRALTGAVHTLVDRPRGARAAYVLAHGAGAGMAHPFMAAVAAGLAERKIATLRYQFPYMEKGSRRVDAPAVAHETVRAAVGEARRVFRRLPVVAGGKSFGGRMTSQAQAAEPLPGVRGLAFLGFPLHPPDKPGDERGVHLAGVQVPMLFLQGTNDEFAQLSLLRAQVARLGKRATLRLFDGADHGFHKASMTELCDVLAGWIEEVTT
jgi:uncharacterized protein